MRLIDADSLKIPREDGNSLFAIACAPTIDAVPVVHGRWIDLRQEGDSRFMCSACKWKEHVPTCMGKPTVWEYCPSCGARMDGKDGDT